MPSGFLSYGRATVRGMDSVEVRALLQREWWRLPAGARDREYLRLYRLVGDGIERFEIRRTGAEPICCANKSRALLTVHDIIGCAWVEMCLRCRYARRPGR